MAKLLVFLIQNRSIRHGFRPDNVSAEYITVLNTIRDGCKAGRYRCLFVNQAHSYSVKTPRNVTKYFRWTPPDEDYTLDIESLVHIANLYNGFLKKYSEKNDLFFCDIEAHVPKDGSNMYDEFHLNFKGAEQVAEILTECVMRQRLLD